VGENPRILQKIRSPVFQCSRVHDVGRTLVVFPNKSEAFKLTMNAGSTVYVQYLTFVRSRIFVAAPSTSYSTSNVAKQKIYRRAKNQYIKCIPFTKDV
jgi:hypothetical protein